MLSLGGRAIIWRSIKQTSVVDATMEAKYVATCEAAKEEIWLREFLKSWKWFQVCMSQSDSIVIVVDQWQMPKNLETIVKENT